MNGLLNMGLLNYKKNHLKIRAVCTYYQTAHLSSNLVKNIIEINPPLLKSELGENNTLNPFEYPNWLKNKLPRKIVG